MEVNLPTHPRTWDRIVLQGQPAGGTINMGRQPVNFKVWICSSPTHKIVQNTGFAFLGSTYLCPQPLSLLPLVMSGWGV